MSFSESNQYFFKYEFHGKMKGLPLNEKVHYYRKELQQETRRRIKEYFSEQIPLREKVKDYSDILYLLKDVDFEYILLSIYFDQDSTSLFRELEHALKDCIPKSYNDRFLLLPLLECNPNIAAKSVKLFLKSFFIKYVDVTESEWMNKESAYDLIKKLVARLKNNIKQPSSKDLTFLILFHYSKLWAISFSKPYKYDHGIMLLKEMFFLIKETNESERSDFRQMLLGLNSILQNLSCFVPGPPFLDAGEDHGSKIGYLKWLNDFRFILKTKGEASQSLIGPSFKELINSYYDPNVQKQNQLFEIFKSKLLKGEFPTSEEVELLRQKYYSAKLRKLRDSKKLYKEFVRITYQFETIDLYQ